MPLHHRHDYAAGLHRGLPVRRHHPAGKFPAGLSRAGARCDPTHVRQVSGRWFRLEERSAAGSSRMPLRLASRARPIWQYWNDSSLSRTAPPTTPTPRQSTVLQLPNACCDRHPAMASHHRQGSRTPRGARSRRPTAGPAPAGRSGARPGRGPAAASGPAIVVRLTLPRTAPARPSSAHQPLHGAAGHRDAFAVQRQPHLPGAVDAVVRRRGPAAISALSSSSRTLAAAGLPVERGRSRSTGRSAHPARSARRRSTRHPSADHRPSRWPWCSAMNSTISGCGRSSSAAKKADAAFKIALARFSSAFSRLNRFSSADSSVVIPGRRAAIDLGLAHPLAHRLRRPDPQQPRDLAHRRPLRLVLATDLGDHPDRPLTQLRRVPPRRTP